MKKEHYKLSEKEIDVARRIIPKSTKVVVKFFEAEYNDINSKTGLIIPETAKEEFKFKISVDKMSAYLKAHPFIGVVMSVGTEIQKTESYQTGDILLLRSYPAASEVILIEDIYYCIDNSSILCAVK